MADTKISALSAVGSVAGANEVAVNEAGTTKKATATQLKTFVNTAPAFAPGSASAGSWPVLGSGTLLTTPEVGAIERDATNFYKTTDAGNRGYSPIVHFIRADATRTFTSNTSSQTIFNSPANGRLTLEAGAYVFDGLLYLTSMSATSGNALINLIGAGTAVMAAWLWRGYGTDGAAGSPTAISGSQAVTNTTGAATVTAGTGVAMHVDLKGTFEVTTGGTIIPSLTLLTASAAVLAIGSYLRFERIGATNAVSVGQWD